MSFGKFNYIQFNLDDPLQQIEARILLNGKSHAEAERMLIEAEDGTTAEAEKLYETLRSVRTYVDPWKLRHEIFDPTISSSDGEVHGDWRWATRTEVEKHNSEPVFTYSEAEIARFREAIEVLKKAKIYIDQIEKFICSEISAEDFEKQLSDGLAEIEKEKN